MNIKRMICLGLAVLLVLSLPVSFVAFADDYLIEDSGIAEDIFYEDVYYDDLIEEYVDEYVEDPEEFFDSSEIFEESTEEFFDVNDDNSDVLLEESVEEQNENTSEEDAETAVEDFFVEDSDVFSASPLSITTQPEDYTGANGSKATFTVEATSATGTLSYQWQVSSNNGASWKNSGAASAKKATLSFVAKAANSGYLYRCIVSDGTNEVITREAMLTVSSLTITTQPEDYTGVNGSTATYTVEASATGTLSYQWQVSSNGTTWKNSGASGAKTATLSFVAKAANNGYLYRCVVSDGTISVTSKEVVLNVTSDIVVNDVVYSYLDNSTLFVKSYSGNETVLEIPNTINGLTVTQIGADAFAGNTNLKSIDLPDSITVIGARAFKGCTNLSEMR